ncbi:MAG TPA: aspartate aminotransferase family protein [Burkholderiaceae bacterium]|nr:aspartate aminotransferase family protein [Burkholderiaceae bacterium]
MNADDTHVIHRSLRATPPVAVGGEGVWLIDAAGRRYLDASGGAAVSCLGHGHPDVLAAMHRQIDQLAYAHTGFFTTEVAETLADHLSAHAPPGFDHVYFVSGGSEAIEAALKLARQHFVERGEGERALFIGRRQSYHGNTLGALAVGGNEWRRRQFAPLLVDVLRVAPCYEYRDRRAEESQAAYTQRLLDELEATIVAAGPKRVIAFVAETVGGATAGVLTATPGYFKGVREICDHHGVLWIADEVMCGMGRTGSLHAVQQEGAAPDLIAIAKGLGGGYQPIGAVLAHERVIAPLRDGSGFFQHGHTYLGHPTACAAALAVQRVIERDRLLDNVRARGEQLMHALHERLGAHPHVGDLRGRGLFVGVELVADRATKAPFDPAKKLHARLKARAFAQGLLVYPMGGTVDGLHGDHVLLAPPFICTAADIDLIVERLALSIDEALAG